jgi:ribonuclease HII
MPTKLLKFEHKHWNDGVRYVAGIDEAGRGPLAGPIVVAAVILNTDHLFSHKLNKKKTIWEENWLELYGMINDSKKVTAKRRELLFDFIKDNAKAYEITVIEHNKIDDIGIGVANQVGFFNTIEKLKLKSTVSHVLTDHYKIKKYPTGFQTNIIRGDSASLTIAAASILAKVHRDRIMKEMHDKYPEYGFDKHKGYGTKFHREQILKIGPCEIHRRSFEPTKSFLRDKKTPGI